MFRKWSINWEFEEEGKRFQDVLKLDMQKRYDRLKWDFFEACMFQMAFDVKWLEWIMKCLTIVSLSVKFNREPWQPFLPPRGIGQGILCTLSFNVLSFLMKNTVKNGSTNSYFSSLFCSFFFSDSYLNCLPIFCLYWQFTDFPIELSTSIALLGGPFNLLNQTLVELFLFGFVSYLPSSFVFSLSNLPIVLIVYQLPFILLTNSFYELFLEISNLNYSDYHIFSS